jgi:hypothetical protein
MKAIAAVERHSTLIKQPPTNAERLTGSSRLAAATVSISVSRAAAETQI